MKRQIITKLFFIALSMFMPLQVIQASSKKPAVQDFEYQEAYTLFFESPRAGFYDAVRSILAKYPEKFSLNTQHKDTGKTLFMCVIDECIKREDNYTLIGFTHMLKSFLGQINLTLKDKNGKTALDYIKDLRTQLPELAKDLESAVKDFAKSKKGESNLSLEEVQKILKKEAKSYTTKVKKLDIADLLGPSRLKNREEQLRDKLRDKLDEGAIKKAKGLPPIPSTQTTAATAAVAPEVIDADELQVIREREWNQEHAKGMCEDKNDSDKRDLLFSATHAQTLLDVEIIKYLLLHDKVKFSINTQDPETGRTVLMALINNIDRSDNYHNQDVINDLLRCMKEGKIDPIDFSLVDNNGGTVFSYADSLGLVDLSSHLRKLHKSSLQGAAKIADVLNKANTKIESLVIDNGCKQNAALAQTEEGSPSYVTSDVKVEKDSTGASLLVINNGDTKTGKKAQVKADRKKQKAERQAREKAEREERQAAQAERELRELERKKKEDKKKADLERKRILEQQEYNDAREQERIRQEKLELERLERQKLAREEAARKKVKEEQERKELEAKRIQEQARKKADEERTRKELREEVERQARLAQEAKAAQEVAEALAREQAKKRAQEEETRKKLEEAERKATEEHEQKLAQEKEQQCAKDGFYNAIHHGNHDEMVTSLKLITDKNFINTKDSDGYTPLMRIVLFGISKAQDRNYNINNIINAISWLIKNKEAQLDVVHEPTGKSVRTLLTELVYHTGKHNILDEVIMQPKDSSFSTKVIRFMRKLIRKQEVEIGSLQENNQQLYASLANTALLFQRVGNGMVPVNLPANHTVPALVAKGAENIRNTAALVATEPPTQIQYQQHLLFNAMHINHRKRAFNTLYTQYVGTPLSPVTFFLQEAMEWVQQNRPYNSAKMVEVLRWLLSTKPIKPDTIEDVAPSVAQLATLTGDERLLSMVIPYLKNQDTVTQINNLASTIGRQKQTIRYEQAIADELLHPVFYQVRPCLPDLARIAQQTALAAGSRIRVVAGTTAAASLQATQKSFRGEKHDK